MVHQAISSLWVKHLHNKITGESAYVVVPATMTFKVHGKPITQIGAMFTGSTRKFIDGWHIAALGPGLRAYCTVI